MMIDNELLFEVEEHVTARCAGDMARYFGDAVERLVHIVDLRGLCRQSFSGFQSR